MSDSNSGRFNPAFATVTTLFFMWGFVTASIDPLVPSVRAVFSLSYAESMLTQFAFFLAYGVVSLPAAVILEKLGYAHTILLAVGAMLAGCLLMPVATHLNAYWFVLAALFVIAAGITQLQVAANPLAAMLGKPEGSHFRLTLSQTFNSLGTVLAPIIGSYLILRGGVFKGAVNAASRAEHVDEMCDRGAGADAKNAAFLDVTNGAFGGQALLFFAIVSHHSSPRMKSHCAGVTGRTDRRLPGRISANPCNSRRSFNSASATTRLSLRLNFTSTKDQRGAAREDLASK